MPPSPKQLAHYTRLNVPPPTEPPQERIRSLMATRNEWKLYRRKCDYSKDEIISAYHKDSPFKVYKNEIWWGDSWDAQNFSQPYDFNTPFFEQFAALQLKVPREGTSVFNCTNCDYNSHIRESKNCYLNSLVYKCEDLYYSYWMVNAVNVFDCMLANDSTLCYRCSDSNKIYECIMLEESDNCSNCYFSFQLRGCKNCIFCTNLTNKDHYAHNKKVTKEEFEKIKNEALDSTNKSFDKALAQYKEIKSKTPHRFVHNINCENCEGDHLYNCKNCDNCYESFESEDCFNGISVDHSKDIHNAYSAGWPGCEVTNMTAVIRGSKHLAYCTYCWFSSNLRYCDSLNACESCFGCIGLQHKKHCILNKQYTKEEYELLLPKIIAHMKKTKEWGQFFPPELSPFAYNETAAMDFYPETKEKALALGYKWRNEEPQLTNPKIKNTLSCKSCKKTYKVIPQEIKFYTRLNLPTPLLCPECRYLELRSMRNNPKELYQSTCSKCRSKINTSYNPTRKETIYCEKCFHAELN